jgi:heptosyltransferase I
MPDLGRAPSILIVLLGSLGDVARALPTVSGMRDAIPGARITWAVDARWLDLPRAHRAVDRTVVFPAPGRRTPRTLWRFAQDLRAERYEIALDLQRIFKSGVCALASGAARRVGFSPRDTRERNHWFNNEWIPPYPASASKLGHYLSFLPHLGLPVPVAMDFGVLSMRDPGQLPAPVAALRGPYVTAVLGSSWPSKDWSPKGYQELVDVILRQTGHAVVLSGDQSRRQLATDIARGLDPARVIDVSGQTTIRQLAAVLAHSRVAVGPDTGAGHLAAAVGTPYVTLLGPTSASRVVPAGCERLAVSSLVECEACWRRTCRRREGRCMDAIPARTVWQALAPFLTA